jgi:hypothetical protein
VVAYLYVRLSWGRIGQPAWRLSSSCCIVVGGESITAVESFLYRCQQRHFGVRFSPKVIARSPAGEIRLSKVRDAFSTEEERHQEIESGEIDGFLGQLV